MNYSYALDWALVIGGIAIVINGFFGESLINDVEMPLSKEERENPQPPTRSDRLVHISFGTFLCAYGALQIFK